jgi:protein TonB
MAVGALHLLLIYALISGLYIKIVPFAQHPIFARVLPTIDPPLAPPRPPEIPLQQPMLEQVPKPVVKIDNTQPQGTITVALVEHPTGPLPQPSTPTPSTAIVSLMGTHTTPPYPPLSRRLGEEGSVGLRILIADDGRVSDVEVTRSSGQQRLDDAAKQWVMANWRYRAATKDGHSVASETQAVVVFNLKTARR